MRQKKISESLTIRVFLITAFLLLFAGAITFGFIAWVAPSTYTAVMNDDLAAQVDVLVKQLADTEPEDCGKLLDKFTLSSGATAILTGSDGHLVDTGAQIEVQTVYEAGDMLVTTTEGDSSVSFGTIESSLENTVAITMSEQSTIATEVHFAGQEESYTLYIPPVPMSSQRQVFVPFSCSAATSARLEPKGMATIEAGRVISIFVG